VKLRIAFFSEHNKEACMASTRTIRWIAVSAAVTLATSGFIVRNVHTATKADHLRAEWPECPHDWSVIEVANTEKQRQPEIIALPNGTSVARDKTNIPEFHDCQRIILEDGINYGPLMAVFAAADLALMKFYDDADTAGLKQTMPAAEIFNDSADFSYRPLGIGPKFNCLYILRRGGQLYGKMVHVGSAEKDCARSASLIAGAGTELAVRQTLVNRFADSVFPPVARWDWDSVHKQQYIGIKCGNAWCEVGRKRDQQFPEFVSSGAYVNAPAVLTPEDRVRAIKGWYDQQIVAVDEGVTAKPGKVRATFFPHPDLGRRTEAAFSRRWVPVSYVAFEGPPGLYKKKFNFDRVRPRASLADMNEISFCRGTRAECGIPSPLSISLLRSCGKTNLLLLPEPRRWWARVGSKFLLDGVTRSGGPNYMYKCVTQRVHKGVQIPPTARWRWLADDETEWQYCPSGCCEVQAAFQ
jgi:hypothetical protein